MSILQKDIKLKNAINPGYMSFAETVLKIFDLWLSLGTIKRGTAS